MVTLLPIEIEGHTVMGVEVKLPKTTLLAIYTTRGYIMCGALDVGLLNQKLGDRQIIAGRAVGVRTLEDLLEAPLESVTVEAEKWGVHPGLKGKDAIIRML
ncbi:Uncharacterized protein YunC, DUF1805 family [Paenibacillus uliginis N3/975]|uniref:Uncharacterized protein YunC, DUF1805 family n=1 Tax=Paenibacillus uliginis N3/975 TaxID=1313296 RepID=A0A1X7GYY9_9BACL|nr:MULTISPECIES: DUF1805 domain-containing protein [Paenibacillus]UNK17324.1 DUF1805 domain-containing protein [Paenibacillus sp. N3/727]SMF76112.1 Uncharacterized protein YunC, DUF1805 family [Paenibacillus uliginis N3/975]